MPLSWSLEGILKSGAMEAKEEVEEPTGAERKEEAETGAEKKEEVETGAERKDGFFYVLVPPIPDSDG